MPKLRKQTFETSITEALRGTRVSSGTVSKLNKKIYKHIEAWRDRPIEGDYPYVYLYGIVLKRSWAGEIKDADWQRCTVQVYRNVSSYVPRNKARDVAAMLKAIHAQVSR